MTMPADLIGQRIKLQHLKIVHAVADWGSMAKAANALGIRFCAHIPGDTPQEKINAMRVFGRYVLPELHFDPAETVVEKARRVAEWCKAVSMRTGEDWRYRLLRHDRIKEGDTLEGMLAGAVALDEFISG